jgi:hypothetical protein
MSEIKPALTAEEWASFLGDLVTPVGWLEGGCYWSRGKGDGHDGAAAMLLHGQPFGFTREDVVNHREAAQACVARWQTIGPGSLHDWHRSMADRIEALLPTEESEGR